MGNTEGNTAVENEGSATHMLASSVTKDLKKSFFYTGNEANIATKPLHKEPKVTEATGVKVHTTIKGQVIALPASFKSNGVMDFHEEQVRSDVTERINEAPNDLKWNGRLNSNEKTEKSPKSTQLKFGIANILSDKDDSKKDSTETALDRQNIADSYQAGFEASLKMLKTSANCFGETTTAKDQRTNNQEEASKQFPRQFLDILSLQYQRLSPYRMSSDHQRKSHSIQYHPYKQEQGSRRAYSDKTKDHMELGISSPEKSRRRSESPNSRPLNVGTPYRRDSLSPSTLTMRPATINNASAIKNGLTHWNSKTSPRKESSMMTYTRPRSLNSSPNAGHELTLGVSPNLPRKDKVISRSFTESISPNITGYPGYNKLYVSDSDEVFNDDVNHRQTSPISPKTSTNIWERHFSSQGEFPSSPEYLMVPDLAKTASFPFFPHFNGTNPLFPSSAPPHLNLQAWQNLAASCHPALRHLAYNPYAYMAAMRPLLKNMSSPSLQLMRENLPSRRSPSLSGFEAQKSSNQQSSCADRNGGPRKRRKWSRAVFTLLQRRGLEKSFQLQKYVAKPERRGLAEALGLTDAQVKIWFQNRRMKWRQEQKNNSNKHGPENLTPTSGESSFGQTVHHEC